MASASTPSVNEPTRTSHSKAKAIIKAQISGKLVTKVRSRSLCTWGNRDNLELLGQFIIFLDQNDRHSLGVLLIY